MNKLIEEIEKLKNSGMKMVIDSRIKEFEEIGKKSSNEIFNELCFCLMTANFSAQGGIKIQNGIGDGFASLPEEELAKRLSELGHRFPNARAKFVVEARRYRGSIREKINSFSNEREARDWLAQNVKGLGMKEASHFLRNIGYKNIAIIDFHIIDLLVREGLIEKPKSKSLSAKKYIEIEKILEEISKKAKISLGELDLYLWYMETGKVLK